MARKKKKEEVKRVNLQWIGSDGLLFGKDCYIDWAPNYMDGDGDEVMVIHDKEISQYIEIDETGIVCIVLKDDFESYTPIGASKIEVAFNKLVAKYHSNICSEAKDDIDQFRKLMRKEAE